MGFDYSRANVRWRNLRAQVLREANYQCQWARRYGRRIPATRVHHIWPAEDWPEYAYCKWNLVALSLEGHMAMHKPGSGELSAAGEALRRRTVPPSGEKCPRVADAAEK